MLAPKFQDAQEGHFTLERKKKRVPQAVKLKCECVVIKKLKKYLGIKVQSCIENYLLYIPRLHLHERRTLHSYPQ